MRRRVTIWMLIPAMLLVFLQTIALITVPAMAGGWPEYDAVGCDAANFFSSAAAEQLITTNAILNPNSSNPVQLEYFSDWTVIVTNSFSGMPSYQVCSTGSQAEPGFGLFYLPVFGGVTPVIGTNIPFTAANAGCLVTLPGGSQMPGVTQWEFFTAAADSPEAEPDACFPATNSYLTSAFDYGDYEWQIVLQSKPDSDMNVKIHDCVLRNDSQSPFGTSALTGAAQTGRYYFSDLYSTYSAAENPQIWAFAVPGPSHQAGFYSPFVLATRSNGTLGGYVPLAGLYYESKGTFPESILVALPGPSNGGYGLYDLHAGDMINVHIELTGNVPVDIRYGPQSVLLEYIGLYGSATYNAGNSQCHPSL